MNITASTTAGEIMTEFPELVDYFMDLGICGCNFEYTSDLLWSVEQIAEEKDLNLFDLLENLNRRIH